MKGIAKITSQLFQGPPPSPGELADLCRDLKIKKVISLDEESADKIARACKMLGVKQVVFPIKMKQVKLGLLDLLKNNLKSLFLENGPVFVHGQKDEDISKVIVALVECKYLDKKPAKVLQDLDLSKFDSKSQDLFQKLIKSCRSESDYNEADIVSNVREYQGKHHDSFIDQFYHGSFAPYLSVTRQNPMDAVYNFIVDQSPTRQNYQSTLDTSNETNVIPQVGVYNNDAGMRGAGPSENNGGFIYN